MAARVAKPGGMMRQSPWAIDEKVDRFKRGAPSSHGRQKHQPVPDLLRVANPQAGRLRSTCAPWAVEEDNSHIFAKPSNIIGAGIHFSSNFGDESDADDQKDAVRPHTTATKQSALAQPPVSKAFNSAPQEDWIIDHSDETVKHSKQNASCFRLAFDPFPLTILPYRIQRPASPPLRCIATALQERCGAAPTSSPSMRPPSPTTSRSSSASTGPSSHHTRLANPHPPRSTQGTARARSSAARRCWRVVLDTGARFALSGEANACFGRL